MTTVVSPLIGTIVAIECQPGDRHRAGAALVIIESMKMEHVVSAPEAMTITAVVVTVGATVAAGDPLVEGTPIDEASAAARIDPTPETPASESTGGSKNTGSERTSGETVRADLAEVIERHRIGLDDARPEAIAKRHARGQRSTRENLADLLDADSFVEYAPLVIAAQRRRRSTDDLIANTPADGLVMGFGRVNGALVSPAAARCAVMAYDYTVLAGTQGIQNHRKSDRLLSLVAQEQIPLVLFSEGGGGRPGDTDGVGIAGLDSVTFARFAALSGQVPLVGINSGYCFAGNAALLGCCDVIIATENSSIGMAGPAMIEGGGLGVVAPSDVGPIDVQRTNGVVDLVATDEAHAVALAKQWLSYFQGPTPDPVAPDPDQLRHVVPENRLRVYDMHAAIDGIADVGSVLELQPDWAVGIITCLARVDGQPIAIAANNPGHLAGAVDPDGAGKLSRFLGLCNRHGLPVLFLCDTPGFMVGPDIERLAMVRRAGDLYIAGAKLDVPFGTIVTRKGYGLGAMAMAGGGFKENRFTVGWPTSEFGGMGLEGYVRLGFRKEIEAAGDEAAQQAAYEERLAQMYEAGKGLSAASHFEIDDVIDPADSRRWIRQLLASQSARQ